MKHLPRKRHEETVKPGSSNIYTIPVTPSLYPCAPSSYKSYHAFSSQWLRWEFNRRSLLLVCTQFNWGSAAIGLDDMAFQNFGLGR